MDHAETPLTRPIDGSQSLEEVLLRSRLKFFFQNPIEKWHTKKRLPFKFIVQVIKIILGTVQLCIFAQNRNEHIYYGYNNKLAFSHLFLNVWDASREVTNYPPAAGPLALYQTVEFYESADFIVQRYARLNETIGPYAYVKIDGKPAPITYCIEYTNSNIGGDRSPITNDHLNDDGDDDELFRKVEVPAVCWNITETSSNFSIQEFMKKENISFSFLNVGAVRFRLLIEAIVHRSNSMRCSLFDINILFDNTNMNGQLLVNLKSNRMIIKCGKEITHFAGDSGENKTWQIVLNNTIIIVCTTSFFLCCRSMIRAQLLKFKTIKFFRRVKHTELSFEGKLEFWNFWYIMIIINDILIMVGSFGLNRITRNDYSSEEWSFCSLCLGTGNMLVWFGVLRYLGFFKTYNVVILTLKRASPQMMRFLMCTLIIYGGFVFCGWLVLGPYHIKFRTISRTSENLFSLINGDDMFATFAILDSSSTLLWWYSRLYLYSFISLFIYVILNLFMSVILDAYETIKEYYLHGFPRSDLQEFILQADDNECIGEPFSNDLRSYESIIWHSIKRLWSRH